MEKEVILETERLYLREMTQDDFPSLCKILQDEKTMYAYEGAFTDAEAQEWMDRQPWKAGEVLEIGYLLNRSHWHKGYAIEAAKACKQYAFAILKADEVCSIIRDTNKASQTVAERNGMKVADTWIKHYRGVDMPHYRYVIYS